MYVCTDGWMDGWTDGWMYGCMYARMHACMQREKKNNHSPIMHIHTIYAYKYNTYFHTHLVYMIQLIYVKTHLSQYSMARGIFMVNMTIRMMIIVNIYIYFKTLIICICVYIYINKCTNLKSWVVFGWPRRPV